MQQGREQPQQVPPIGSLACDVSHRIRRVLPRSRPAWRSLVVTGATSIMSRTDRNRPVPAVDTQLDEPLGRLLGSCRNRQRRLWRKGHVSGLLGTRREPQHGQHAGGQCRHNRHAHSPVAECDAVPSSCGTRLLYVGHERGFGHRTHRPAAYGVQPDAGCAPRNSREAPATGMACSVARNARNSSHIRRRSAFPRSCSSTYACSWAVSSPSK